MNRAAHRPTGSDGYRHEALIYGSDDELLEVAVPFLQAGTEAGQPTVLRLNPRQEALILDALDDRNGITTLPRVDPRSPVAALRSTHALVSELTAGGVRPLRMLGEIPHEPWPWWVRYEAAVNVVLGPLPAWGLCPYDTRATPPDVIADVERTHPLYATGDLRGAPNPRFEDPLAFLNRRDARPDALESSAPHAELTNPTPVAAGNLAGALAHTTALDADDTEGLRLAVTAVTANALKHGRPPIRVRVWVDVGGVVATVTDAGSGPRDPLSGILHDGTSPDESSSLYHVRDAVSDVAQFTSRDGFTVRLVQRPCSPPEGPARRSAGARNVPQA